MDTIKAILIDDEPRANSVLNELLLKSAFDIVVHATCESLLQGIRAIKEIRPDVVFLDVQMPNYAGYEIASFFDEITFEIIFITAYDKYAIKAFELCAIDYLLKPIKRARLHEALTRLKLRLDDKNNAEQYQLLLKTIQDKKQDKLIIPEMGNRRIIDISDIIAIEANGAYTIIHLLQQPKVTTSKNLKHYENLLNTNKLFYRTHRSWMINFNYLKRFNRTLSVLYLRGDVEAKISRKQYQEFTDICENT
ncbi:LytR/AlgR family response regulator transcription factor [Spongiimicrobium salis]|uniref:LytR/AlgR family response regulator transcription factor n=1 Tax=Spongiimicrobium salis TaxID=1667022 RepID=UPI00374CB0F8